MLFKCVDYNILDGMDDKTLCTIMGHVSSGTTLKAYTRVTDDMRKETTMKIEQSIAKEAPCSCAQAEVSYMMTGFKPQRRKRRYGGSSYLGPANGEGYRWNGRYTIKRPDGMSKLKWSHKVRRTSCLWGYSGIKIGGRAGADVCAGRNREVCQPESK